MAAVQRPVVPRGLKRRAEDNLEKERLTKRFHELSLEHIKQPSQQLQARHDVGHNNITEDNSVAPMQVDETPNRIYIADIDAELSSDDASDENKVVFLPDVDKRLMKIPKALLTSQNPPLLNTHTELVLYSVPSSLSVPAEQDNVRKAIIEARARVREEQQREYKLAQEQEAAAQWMWDGMQVDEGIATQEMDEREMMRDMDDQEDADAMDLG
ncbi:MAG: hypothetical protein M1823_001982 [Watsoniomyces obsoletus]|nr:MAG: hypothetical protein M1823_001982 [Watsoniomyces obsoletus]